MCYRRRVCEELKDGESVIVHLKNRAIEQTEDEEDWYEKAFGEKQNMMSLRIMYAPLKPEMKQGKMFDLIARLKFDMFKELAGQFSAEDYPPEKDFYVDPKSTKVATNANEEAYEYTMELDYPYGDF